MQLDQYLSDIAAGDHEAFILLYDAVSAPLYGLQLRILKDPQFAQDALRDTFLGIWDDAKSFNARHGTPMVWLNIQARKQALQTLDTEGVRDLIGFGFPELSPDAWLSTAQECWDSESADEFEQLLVRLETLDTDAQACIVSLYCDGFNLEELSEVLNAPTDTIKSWVREGLANLQVATETGVDETEWNLEAAEYVLGTHTQENERVYDALYRVDADWQRRVQNWRAELNPLHASTVPEYPPDWLIDTILDELDTAAAPLDTQTRHRDAITDQSIDATSADDVLSDYTDSEDTLLIGTVQPASTATELAVIPGNAAGRDLEPTSGPSSTVHYWQDKARYWQLSTLVAAVSFIGLLFVGPAYMNRQSASASESLIRTVAVLQDDADQPLWVVTLAPPPVFSFLNDDSPGSVTITAVGDPETTTDEQSHQLWMGSTDTDILLPVGALPAEQGDTTTLALPAELADSNEFVVSLELQEEVTGPDYGPVVTRSAILQQADEES